MPNSTPTKREMAEKAMHLDFSQPKNLRLAFNCVRYFESEDTKAAHAMSAELRKKAQRSLKETKNIEFQKIIRDMLLFDAPHNFDAFCQYIELNRPLQKRFYLPRRKQLLKVANALQQLADGELDLLIICMPPGVGKTTIALFYLAWCAGRNPDNAILSGSHSASILRGMYDELIRIMSKDGEYLWSDVFNGSMISLTDAKDMKIDIGTKKGEGRRFSTLQFSSVGSNNSGKLRAMGLLYLDDLVGGIEEAMSKDRMDKLWTLYATDYKQRKLGNVPELHIATPWSLTDVVDRLRDMNADNPRAKCVVMPALDENGESNFEYPFGLGYTTADFLERKQSLDDASWQALFMMQPIEREGQLYNQDELRRYFELPDSDPDSIIFVCDTKDKGDDYCVIPIAYKYGEDYYIEEILCDNGDPKIVEARIVELLCRRNPQCGQFESNSAGGQIAEKIQKQLKAMGCRTKIITRYTTANKETKIIVNSPWVKEHMLFKSNEAIAQDRDYRRALNMLTTYTMAGKNKHDDVPDAFAMLALYAQSFSGFKAVVSDRIF